ncbi:thiamine-phosphate synthase [Azorhizobium oxalatiphilum]|uniref:Thiamine-phosphate synthase n=1 Tax=Azorhizobium oxalatiphilum TaxID=980631 RepID=A0A917FII0_9HYPH|nr:thiamine phosphate synthase [Azorhizobium oxalatiphilum]GGF80785.1 thiamine-phosphate synthase [Azorhizobium oxalatiphilum]
MSHPFDLTLYLVTDPRQTAARGLSETVEQAVAGGATIVQLRDPDAKGRALAEQARALLTLLKPHNIPLIINDRVDVAAAVGAQGVHLGQDDLAPAVARAILGREAIVGLSIGSVEELAASDLGPVDYVGCGPVNATGTKGDAGGAIGVAGLNDLRARIQLPMVAIGGLKGEDVQGVMEAGADGIAVVSALCAAPDVAAAARALKASVLEFRRP